MKRLYRFKHIEAHRIIINAINKGQHGRYFMIADVAKESVLQQRGIHLKRIPEWILADSRIADTTLHRMMYIEMMDTIDNVHEMMDMSTF